MVNGPPSRRVVSFALWGRAAKYLVGAVRNAQLAPFVYPGWEAHFYVQADAAELVRATLLGLGAGITELHEPASWRGLFWRFAAIGQGDVDVAIFRDCDSRLSLREAVAVEAWLQSGRTLHVMRDHPSHRHPIMGGMWGVRCDRARWIAAEMDVDGGGQYWQADQEYLARSVWPKLKDDCLEHDEFFRDRPFPTPRVGDEFVGQVYDEYDMPCETYVANLRRALNKTPFVTNSR